MDIIANAVTRFIQAKCAALADLWKSPFAQVEETLTQVTKETFRTYFYLKFWFEDTFIAI
jgi:hypothetical protein